jgi:hypothetical protein
MIPAYPLQWPVGWPRTPSYERGNAHFSTDKRWLTINEGVARVLKELGRIGIERQDVVISTNVRVRLDGFPRGDEPAPADPGVATYWETRKHERMVMAIDRYNEVAGNLGAIAATLEAMRAIERHGGARILERAFTGFTALPSQVGARPWREVLKTNSTSFEEVKRSYRTLASKAHPDKGGTVAAMAALNAALEQAERELCP